MLDASTSRSWSFRAFCWGAGRTNIDFWSWNSSNLSVYSLSSCSITLHGFMWFERAGNRDFEEFVQILILLLRGVVHCFVALNLEKSCAHLNSSTGE